MDLQTYLEQAKRTATPQEGFNPPAPMYYHWLLGIWGEMAEIQTCGSLEIKDELGDLFWYIANFCDAMGFDIRVIAVSQTVRLQPDHAVIPKAYIHLSMMCEALKKHDWYTNRPKEKSMGLAKAEFRLFVEQIQRYVVMCGLTLDEVLAHNIDKLIARYPEGFNG